MAHLQTLIRGGTTVRALGSDGVLALLWNVCEKWPHLLTFMHYAFSLSCKNLNKKPFKYFIHLFH